MAGGRSSVLLAPRKAPAASRGRSGERWALPRGPAGRPANSPAPTRIPVKQQALSPWESKSSSSGKGCPFLTPADARCGQSPPHMVGGGPPPPACGRHAHLCWSAARSSLRLARAPAWRPPRRLPTRLRPLSPQPVLSPVITPRTPFPTEALGPRGGRCGLEHLVSLGCGDPPLKRALTPGAALWWGWRAQPARGAQCRWEPDSAGQSPRRPPPARCPPGRAAPISSLGQQAD